MNRTKLNYWIDVGLAISFLTCFITGLIKWPGLIKLIGTSAYRTLHIRNISLFHDWSGLIMGLLVLIHLALHWKWIVCMTKSIFKGGKKAEMQGTQMKEIGKQIGKNIVASKKA